jgi:hypothetical protein
LLRLMMMCGCLVLGAVELGKLRLSGSEMEGKEGLRTRMCV